MQSSSIMSEQSQRSDSRMNIFKTSSRDEQDGADSSPSAGAQQSKQQKLLQRPAILRTLSGSSRSVVQAPPPAAAPPPPPPDDNTDDEEVRQALAMALAAQSNPNLTTRELHELLGTQQPQQQLIPKKLTSSTTTTTTSETTTASFTTYAKTKFNEILQKDNSNDGLQMIRTVESTDSTERKLQNLGAPLLSCNQIWKRRGGMGKYQRSNSWEQRLVKLYDNGLLVYYNNDNTENSVRGHLDILKENASVHVSLGHSGAPTPFCISIKVQATTKWKLSFPNRRTQMVWLVKLNECIVQASVDAHNVELLNIHQSTAASDSVNTINNSVMMDTSSSGGSGGVAEQQQHQQPPSSPNQSNKQLWMLDAYCVKSDEYQEAPALPTFTAEDHAQYRHETLQQAPKLWILAPEKLYHAAFLFNVGLYLSRTLDDTGFWNVVVFFNFALAVWCVEWPRYEAILERVYKVPDPPASNPGSLPTKHAPAYIPDAGSSAMRMEKPTDTPKNDKDEMFTGWCQVPGSILKVRSHGYSVTKQKVPSPGELYECVAVDVFESPSRYPDMAPRVKLPPANFTDHDTKTWRSPDIFIISIALPTDPPKMGRTSSDGGGYTVTMYYRMKEDTREILKRITADGYDVSTETNIQNTKVNAVRLLEEWVRRAPTDPKFQSRFKVVPNAHNLKEIGMPAWISKYNGKPFLIKRPDVTGFLHMHPELSAVEFDITLHPFPYLAKQGICFMKDSYFKKVLVTFGFVIEGRSDDELPECVIGLMQLCYPDPQYAIQAKDFFAGTAPRSFESGAAGASE